MDSSDPISYFLAAVNQIGFPIVLTGYLLLRFEKKLELLTSTILKLIEVINKEVSENDNGK
jgi:YvrJ protein family